jgi:hypothetical protein
MGGDLEGGQHSDEHGLNPGPTNSSHTPTASSVALGGTDAESHRKQPSFVDSHKKGPGILADLRTLPPFARPGVRRRSPDVPFIFDPGLLRAKLVVGLPVTLPVSNFGARARGRVGVVMTRGPQQHGSRTTFRFRTTRGI